MLQTAASIINRYSNTAVFPTHRRSCCTEGNRTAALLTHHMCIYLHPHHCNIQTHLLWYVLSKHVHARVQTHNINVVGVVCCEKKKIKQIKNSSHFGSETVPAEPMSCHFWTAAAINSVTVRVHVCVYPRLYCPLSSFNRGERGSQLN